LFAGLAGFACSQEAREPVEVGTAQVELRSDLVIPGKPGSSTALLAEKNRDHPGLSMNPMPGTQRGVKRHEIPPAFREDSKTRKSSTLEDKAYARSWTLADKHWVRAGKGFGVAAERMTPPGSVHPDDAAYYFPAVASKPNSEATEHLEPMAEPFKSGKPLIFHSGATGFAHEPPTDATPSGHSPAFETQLVLSPIPETQVYLSSKPKTQVTLAPAKDRLDLIYGNENLNRNRYYQRDAESGLTGGNGASP
jgi:hypothetical protein